jgi:hypothetical protein
MSPIGFLKARSGQSRILEAVIAAAIIFIVFSASMFLIRASDVKILQERADLDRLGYNVLHRLVESGIIEKTLESWPSGSGFAEAILKTAVQRSLPSKIYFNLEIFNCTERVSAENPEDKIVRLEPLPYDVSNAPPELFAKSLEVSSTSLIYTSKRGNIYHLVLVLARAGGE